MQGLKKRRRIQIAALLALCLVLATALIGYGLRDGIAFFRAPAQVLEDPPKPGEVFRLGGLVAESSVVRGEGTRVLFAVTDGAAEIPVRYDGILPDLFGEGQGVVATGALVAGVFEATEILAKHDENYMPREVVDALKAQGVFVPPNGQ